MLTNKDILTPPIFLSYSLGCRTNQAEIENISLQLSAYGFTPYSPPCTSAPLHLCTYPTIVMLNTCVVTQKAEKETRQKIRELKRKYPKSFLVVLGCAVTAMEKFNINIPNVDLLISNEEKPKIISLILKQIHAKLSDSISVRNNPLLNKYQLSGRKFIKIQDGCNKFCSYCLTCLIREKPTSIPSQEIIKEINFWVEKGIKEIILTGINLSLYVFKRSDLQGGRTSISTLIKKILRETKVKRLSLSSIDPEMLLFNRSDLLTGRTCLSSLAVNNPRITQCFHLSLQSGSSTVLERMERKTDLDKLLEMLKTIKKQNPFFTFRADIIVGFPSETEKEFEETINFIKKAKISFVHSFLFSFRPGTKLEGMIKSGKWQEIPLPIKKQRAEILKKEVEKIRKEEAEKMINQSFPCLIIRKINCHSRSNRESTKYCIDSRSRPSGLSGMTMWEGITENGWPVLVEQQSNKATKPCTRRYVAEQQSLKGKILPVKIVNFDENYLLGKIVSLPT